MRNSKKPRKEKAARRDSVKLIFFVCILLSVGALFFATPALLPCALLSLLLFFVFTPIVDRLERRGFSRSLAIAGLFLLSGSALGIAITLVYPKLTQELAALQSGKVIYLKQFEEKLKIQEVALKKALPFLQGMDWTEKFIDWFNKSMNAFWEFMPQLASNLFICAFVVPLLTFVLLRDSLEIRQALLSLVPNRHFESTYSILYRVMRDLGKYVSARILEASLVSGLTFIFCASAHIPYASVLGLIAGLTNPIPYLGPLIGFLPAFFLAVLDPQISNQLFWSALIFLTVNTLDTVVLFPMVVARVVQLHPLIVVLSVILGSQFFGVLGMLLAVPVTSVVKIFLLEIHSRVYESIG